MAAKCGIFMNCSKHFIDICKKKKKKTKEMAVKKKKEYMRDHRCEGKNMAYRCKIFEAVKLTLHTR